MCGLRLRQTNPELERPAHDCGGERRRSEGRAASDSPERPPPQTCAVNGRSDWARTRRAPIKIPRDATLAKRPRANNCSQAAEKTPRRDPEMGPSCSRVDQKTRGASNPLAVPATGAVRRSGRRAPICGGLHHQYIAGPLLGKLNVPAVAPRGCFPPEAGPVMMTGARTLRRFRFRRPVPESRRRDRDSLRPDRAR